MSWVSVPTWNNHIPLLGQAGINLREYAYYDTDSNSLRFGEMMDCLEKAIAGDLVLLHGCCHNPTGMDLSAEQWLLVADLVVRKELVPLIDIAYQGFATDVDTDAYGVRLLFGSVPEVIVTSSCSKNFGLYRDRAGTLMLVTENAKSAKTVTSQALSAVRTMYSIPPDHGAAIVSKILNDDDLHAEWLAELREMRERMTGIRSTLVAALKDVAPDHDFSHIERTHGMFCYLGVSPEQVDRLIKERGVYLVNSSRINVCGITEGNVAYLAESIASVL